MPKANNERWRTGRRVGREERCVVGDEQCEANSAEQLRGNYGASATIAPEEPRPTTNYPIAQQAVQLEKLDLVGVSLLLWVAFRA